MLLKLCLGASYDVDIVGSCKSLVGSDNQISSLCLCFLLLILCGFKLLLKIMILYVRSQSQNVAYSRAYCIIICLDLVHALSCLAYLGGGYEIHGIGDLHGLPDAAYAIKYFLRACHLSSPS